MHKVQPIQVDSSIIAIDLGLVSPCSALRGLYSTPSKSANLCTPSSPPGGH